MSSLRRVGILTGGGDVPGLNSCIRAFTLRALDEGIEVLGIRRGWGGLLEIDPSGIDSAGRLDAIPSILRLERETVRTVGRHGGTFLHTSRTNPASVKRSELPDVLRTSLPEDAAAAKEKVDVTAHVLRVLNALGLDALVAIGGDDTLSYAVRLDKEGFPVIAIPKTMDNDVPGTDYCIGFSTAVTRSVEFIHSLRTAAGSHERIAVIELFGRYSGETSLISAYLAGADRAVISEVDYDQDKLLSFLVQDRNNNPSAYAIVTISEGAKPIGSDMHLSGEADAYGHQKLGGVGLHLAGEIAKHTGINTLYQQVAYLMRCGEPDVLDRMVATTYGNLATGLLLKKQSGLMVALKDGKYTTVSADVISQGHKRVDVDELYDVEQYRPKVAHLLGKPMFLY